MHFVLVSESQPRRKRLGWDSETSGEKSISHGKPYTYSMHVNTNHKNNHADFLRECYNLHVCHSSGGGGQSDRGGGGALEPIILVTILHSVWFKYFVCREYLYLAIFTWCLSVLRVAAKSSALLRPVHS